MYIKMFLALELINVAGGLREAWRVFMRTVNDLDVDVILNQSKTLDRLSET